MIQREGNDGGVLRCGMKQRSVDLSQVRKPMLLYAKKPFHARAEGLFEI